MRRPYKTIPWQFKADILVHIAHDPMVCSVGTDTRDRYSANYSLSLKFETVDFKINVSEMSVIPQLISMYNG